MSLPDLAAVLWRQRDLLERLVYRLECEHLLLAAGRTRFLALATAEVEGVLLEHREALLALTSELAALAETNRTLMAAGMRAVESAIAGMNERVGTPSVGYDAKGRSDLISGAGAL